MYRLHIDIPLGEDAERATSIAREFTKWILLDEEAKDRIRRVMGSGEGMSLNYRLGNDADRQKSNYLDINENGHVSTKKIRVDI